MSPVTTFFIKHLKLLYKESGDIFSQGKCHLNVIENLTSEQLFYLSFTLPKKVPCHHGWPRTMWLVTAEQFERWQYCTISVDSAEHVTRLPKKLFRSQKWPLHPFFSAVLEIFCDFRAFVHKDSAHRYIRYINIIWVRLQCTYIIDWNFLTTFMGN